MENFIFCAVKEIPAQVFSCEFCEKFSGHLFYRTHYAKTVVFHQNLFSKCDQTQNQIWSHLLTKPLIENFIFCAVTPLRDYLYFCHSEVYADFSRSLILKIL